MNEQSIVGTQCLTNNINANEAYVNEHYPNDIFISDISLVKGRIKYSKGLIIPENVKIAEIRIPINSEQREILRKELKQAELLAKLGCSVYLIPERAAFGERPKDAVVNGVLFEFRTVTGNARTLEWEFRDAKKKGINVNVFIHVISDINRDEVRRRVKLVIDNHPEYTRAIVMSLSKSDKLYFWETESFR